MGFRITFLILIVMFLHLVGVSDSVSLKDPVRKPRLLPLIPENRTLTTQIEQALRQNRSSAEIICQTKETPARSNRNGILIHPYRRWRDFNVYTDSSYSDEELTLINNAMVRLKQVIPCVNFQLFDPAGSPPGRDYVHIYNGQGCLSSDIGRVGRRQSLVLERPKCMTVGTIMHEMIHALGFDHEHVRADRDSYVTIHWENIQHGRRPLFEKLNDADYSTFGVPYNQRSIMHYGQYFFGRQGSATITAKNGGTVGPTGELEDTDIEKLRRMYQCGGTFGDNIHNCEFFGDCLLSDLLYQKFCSFFGYCWE